MFNQRAPRARSRSCQNSPTICIDPHGLAYYVEPCLHRFVRADFKADLFSFAERDAEIEKAERLDGKLMLVTNVSEVVARYKALADIERGFRVLKSDLDIASVYHRLPERIRAHALICFLALLMHRVMRQRLKAAGRSESVERALRELKKIQHHQVKFGTDTLTAIGRAEPAQSDLFQALSASNTAVVPISKAPVNMINGLRH